MILHTETMHITAGKVGIGTASPGVALEVIGSISGSATSTGSFGVYGNHFIPSVDNTHSLGTATHRWSDVFTTDLQLSNEGKPEGNEVDGTTGSWTIQEGEDNLYLLNRKNGKKYKFKLEEIG